MSSRNGWWGSGGRWAEVGVVLFFPVMWRECSGVRVRCGNANSCDRFLMFDLFGDEGAQSFPFGERERQLFEDVCYEGSTELRGILVFPFGDRDVYGVV